MPGRVHFRTTMCILFFGLFTFGCAAPEEYNGAVHAPSGTTTAVVRDGLKGYWLELGEFHTEWVKGRGDQPDPAIEQVAFADSNRPLCQFELKHHSGRTVTVKSGRNANGQVRKTTFFKPALYSTVGTVVDGDRQIGGFELSALEKAKDGDPLGTLQTPSGPIQLVFRHTPDEMPGGKLTKLIASRCWIGEDYVQNGRTIASRRHYQITVEPGVDFETRMCITALMGVQTAAIYESMRNSNDTTNAISTARLAASLK